MTATRPPIAACNQAPIRITPPLITPEQLVSANRYRIQAPQAPAYHRAIAWHWGHLITLACLDSAARRYKRTGQAAATKERSLRPFEVRATVEGGAV